MINLCDLSPSLFENLAFDIIKDMDFHSVQWRTPGSDGGRDIEAYRDTTDPTSGLYSEKWFVECKRYTESVNWPTIYEKIAHAAALNADYLFVLVSSSASPQCIDRINTWNAEGGRLRIRIWGHHDIISYLEIRHHLLLKYGLCEVENFHFSPDQIALELTKIISTFYALSNNNRDTSRILDYANAISICWSERTQQIKRFGRFCPLPEFTDARYIKWLNPNGMARKISYGDNLVVSWARFVLERDIEFDLCVSGKIQIKLETPLEEAKILNAVSKKTVEYISNVITSCADLIMAAEARDV